MKPLYVSSIILASAAALSGCAAVETATRGAAFLNLQQTNDSLAAPTAQEIADKDGTASYSGVAAFGGREASEDVVGFTGNIDLDADFANNTIGGTVGGLTTAVLSQAEVDAVMNGDIDGPLVLGLLKRVESAGGELTIDGVIAGASTTPSISGDITVGDATYTAGGAISGSFVGSDFEGLVFEEETLFTLTKDGEALSDELFGAQLSN